MHTSDIKVLYIVEALTGAGACDDGLDWLEENRYLSMKDAWVKCRRPSWMAWLIVRYSRRDSAERMKFLKMASEIVLLASPTATIARGTALLVEKYCESQIASDQLTHEITAVIQNSEWENKEFFMSDYLNDCVRHPQDLQAAVSAGFLMDKCVEEITRATCLEIILKHYPEPPNV